jgi:hypothetical protein
LDDDDLPFARPWIGVSRKGAAPVSPYSVNASEERVLFYMADRELHENSGIDWGGPARNAWAERLHLELRLIFLSMNIDGEIVLPPTYFLETAPCRELIKSHMPLVEGGFVKLLVSRASLAEYLENKQWRYQKARHFSVYFDAYFASRSPFGLVTMPFQLSDKLASVGRNTLIAWQRSLLGRSQRYPRFVSRARRFLDLSARTERSAILYENIRENQVAAGLTTEEAYYLDVRSTMNRSYLLSYLRLGFTVPERSALVWSGLTRRLPRSGLDLVALERLVSALHLRCRIVGADAKTLMRWRTIPAVRTFFLSARQLIRDGMSLTALVESGGGKKLLYEIDAALC